MNTKLLLALCCLVVAVQARPKSESSQNCALSCMSTSSWRGFQPGNVYEYDLQQEVQLTSDLSKDQSSRLQLNGSVKIEAHSDCEMQMTVKVRGSAGGNKVDSLNPREAPERVLAALQLPLRFAYESGKISQLCPSEDETRASLNIKRGILSQLQISVEQRGQAKQLQESDILGDCWTEYSPEGQSSIIKNKDLSTCKLSYQIYPLLGVKALNQQKTTDTQKIMKGSLKCRLQLQEDRDIVKKASCVEEQQHSTDGTRQGAKEFVIVKTSLKLKSQSDEIASVLAGVQQRTDLQHQHKTSSECHSPSAWQHEDLFDRGGECNEKKLPETGRSSAEFKKMAKKVVTDLCDQTKDNSVQRYSAQQFADLIKFLRGITEQSHFSQFFEWATTQACNDNTFVKTAVMSAIPSVGTKQSVRLILQQIREKKISIMDQTKWIVRAIAEMQHPTSDILPDLLEFTRSRLNDELSFAEKEESFGLAALTYKVCEEMENCETDPKVKSVIDFFTDRLGNDCSNFATEAKKATVALLSIGNLGRVRGGAATLIGCAKNNKLELANRAFALQSLRRFSQLADIEIEQLISLLQNSSMETELRIVAYQTLARIALTPRSLLIGTIEQILTSQKDDEQVQFYIFTHLANQRQSVKKLVSRILSDRAVAQRMKRLSRRQYSNNFAFNYFSDAFGYEANVDSNLLFTPKSAVPRFVNFNLTVNNPSNGQSVNLLEVGLRMEGLESMVEKFYDTIAKRFSTKKTQERKKRSTSYELSQQQQKLQQAVAEPRIDLLVRKRGVQVLHQEIDKETLDGISSVAQSTPTSELMEVLFQQVKELSNLQSFGQSAGTFNEETISVPTIAGMPILIKQETHYITNMQLKKTLRSASFKKLDAELVLKPSAAVHTSRVFAVDAVFQRVGIESSTNAITNTGVKILLQKNFTDRSNRQFTFKVQPLENKQSIADVKTDVYFFTHNEQNAVVKTPIKSDTPKKEINKCTGVAVMKYTGHKLCVVGRYAQSDSVLRSMRQRPGYFQLFVEKSGDFGYFETTFSLVNKPGNQQLYILIGDKQSDDRHLLLNMQRHETATGSVIKAEAVNSILPLRFNMSVNQVDNAYQTKAIAQVGQNFYEATGTLKNSQEEGLKVNCEMFYKGYQKPKLQITLSHKFKGFTLNLLPMANTELILKTDKSEQLLLKYNIDVTDAKFHWQMDTSFKNAKNEKTALNYRLKLEQTKISDTQSYVLIYDIQGIIKNKLNLLHSLHAKAMRKDSGNPNEFHVNAEHNLKYTEDMRKSPFDCKMSADFTQNVTDDQQYTLSGEAELTYQSNQRDVTTRLENIAVQLGQVDDKSVQIKRINLYSISFRTLTGGDASDVKMLLRYLPISKWSVNKQLFDMETSVNYRRLQAGDNSVKENKLKITHLSSTVAGKFAQTFLLNADSNVIAMVSNKIDRSGSEFQHKFSVETVFNRKLEITNIFTKPKQRTFNIETVAQLGSEKLFALDQTAGYVANEDDHQIIFKADIELKDLKYNINSSTTVSRETAQSFMRWVQYQKKMYTGKYSFRHSLDLFLDLVTSLKYIDKFVLSGPTPKQKLIVETVIDSHTTNGPVWKILIKKSDDTKTQFNYGFSIERQSSGLDLKSNVPAVRNVKLEMIANEQSVKASVQSSMTYKDNELVVFDIDIKSEDSWGFHKVQLQLNRDAANTNNKIKMQLKGQVLEQPIDTQGQLQITNSDTNTGISALIECKMTKSKLEFSLSSQPQKLQSGLKLSCDCPILKVDDLELDFEIERNDKALIKTSMLAKLQKEQKAAFQLNIEQQALNVSVKTALAEFSEAGIVATWGQDTEEGFKQLSGQAKLVAFGQNIVIKQTGKVRAMFSNNFYIDAAMQSDTELQGLDNLIDLKTLRTEVLAVVKKNFEFELMTKVLGDTPDQQIVFSSSYSKFDSASDKPLKLNANLDMDWVMKTITALKLELSSNNFIAEAQVDSKQASIKIGRSISDQSQTAELTARTNIFSTDASQQNVSGKVSITTPEQNVEFFWQNGSSVHAAIDIDSEGKTSKLLEASFINHNKPTGEIYGQGTVQIDPTMILADSEKVNLNLTYEYRLHFDFNVHLIGMSPSRSKELFEAGWYSTGTYVVVDAISQKPTLAGIYFKSDDSIFYSAIFPVFNSDGSMHLTEILWNGMVLLPFAWEVRIKDFKIRMSLKDQNVIEIKMQNIIESTIDFYWKTENQGITNFTMLYDTKNDWLTMLQFLRTDRGCTIKYGDLRRPDILMIAFPNEQISTFEVSHTVMRYNRWRHRLSPNPIFNPFNGYPFEMLISWKSQLKQLNASFSLKERSLLIHKHDFTRFPREITVDSRVQIDQTMKLWDLRVNYNSAGSSRPALQLELPKKYENELDDNSFGLEIWNAQLLDLKAKYNTLSDEAVIQVELRALLKKLENKAVLRVERETKQVYCISFKASMDKLITNTLLLCLDPNEGKDFVRINYEIIPEVPERLSIKNKYSFELALSVSEDEITKDGRFLKTSTVTAEYKKDNQLLNEINSKFDLENLYPVAGEFSSSGIIESSASFNFNKVDGSKSLHYSSSKFGEQAAKWFLTIDTGASMQQSVCRDFKIELKTPKRLYLVSKQTDSSGEVTSQLYLNKQANIGTTVTYKLDTKSDETEFDLEIELPTRTLKLNTQLQSADNKRKLLTRFAYDAEKSPSKSIDFMASLDNSEELVAAVQLDAPFLRDSVKVEARKQITESGFSLRTSVMTGESELMQVKLEYSSEEAEGVSRITIDTSGSAEHLNSRLGLIIRSKINDQTDKQSYNAQVKLTVPSKSIDRNVKFVYIPMQQLSLACDQGASLSIRQVSNQRVSKLVIFASDNQQRASRLTALWDKPKTLLTAALDIGEGSMKVESEDSDLKTEIFKPDQKVVSASAGFTQQGKQAHVAVFVGKMSVGQKFSIGISDDAPSDLCFVTAGVRLAENSQLKYFSNWRLATSDKLNDAIDFVKQPALRMWTSSSTQLIYSTATDGITTVADAISASFDADKLIDEIRLISSNDIDRLTRFARVTIDNNDFFLADIVNMSKQVLSWITTAPQNVITYLSDQIVSFVKDLQIKKLVQSVYTSVSESLTQLSFADFVKEMRRMGEQLTDFVKVGIDAIDGALTKLSEFLSDVYSPDSLNSILSDIANRLYRLDTISTISYAAAKRIVSSARDTCFNLLVKVSQSFIKPFVMRHISDIGSIYNFYNDMLLEARIWYDTGASVTERQAYSRVMQIIEYFISDEAQYNWNNLQQSIDLFTDGQYGDALHQLLQTSSNKLTVWRPECDADCRSGATFASVQGTLYIPVVISSLKPMSWQTQLQDLQAPQIMLRHIKSKLFKTSSEGYVLSSLVSDWMHSGNVWYPVARLLAMKHRTAVIQGDNHLITFDGVSIMHNRPCNYVIAHDFEGGDFSVLQTYKKDSSTNQPQRDQLLVRFGNVRIAIDREGVLKVNDQPKTLPMSESVSGNTIEANRQNAIVEARFHSDIKDVLILRCSIVTDSCVIKVHPLYQGKVVGLAGSNDGRKSNDVNEDSDMHLQFWTAGECTETGQSITDTRSSTTETGRPTEETARREESQCQRLFQSGRSSLESCFGTVAPQPFMDMCQQYQSAGKDVRKVATLYTERCLSEGVRMP